MSTVLKKQTQNPTKALAAMDDLVRTGSTSFFFRCYVTDSDLSFLSLLLLPNSMEEEGEKWSGIELIVVAKKFEANLIKVRDRRWSSKLRWYLEVNFFSFSQLLLRKKKKRSEPSNYLFFWSPTRKFCSALTPKSTILLDNFSMVLILVTDWVLPKTGLWIWRCCRGEMGF